MRRKMQMWIGLLCFFFMLPIITVKLPIWPQQEATPASKQDTKIVYAANTATEKKALIGNNDASFQTLLYFTHSHEAYYPILKSQNKKITAYHDATNVFQLASIIQAHFKQNDLSTDILEVDTMTEMQKKNIALYKAYAAVRPYVKKQLEKKEYDLVLDIHRDSAGKKATTTTLNDEKYARIAIVVGGENKQYKFNEAYAEQLSMHLNKLVPNISRGVMKKEGSGVNGIYNQDLSKKLLVVELGGVDNTEDELNRTIAVLARAIAEAFPNEKSS
ncbi:stage II sporulation protein P [Viridibacillus sp. YIM B01967]|uniref:Stage II sporulation protein P n=1 Tax=Viridibacillus soli TaxID=2798301 RepID=A0ABS1H1P6_9BACL|nr:stage II sporulation protein P [Viridibacillus soli]MBK3493343.1 stage II sporulation protein P [Viridibacillus soli]